MNVIPIDRLRGSRPREHRALALTVRDLRKSMKGMAKTDPVPRPRTRADCSSVPRPCPYVGCRYNLYLDVNEMSGTLKLNFPDLEPWEMPPLGSCVLDIAERQGALSLEDTGGYLNLTRERVRQIQTKAEWRMGPLVRRSL